MTLSPAQFPYDPEADVTRPDGDHYRRYVPLARNEEERLAMKREDAGFAFEMNYPPEHRREVHRATY
jgi:hypothetical protein